MNRRAFLTSAAAVTIAPFAARATPEDLAAAIREVAGDASLREGKVTLDVPPLVENGNTVPLTVSVESPMTDDDHVRAIHVFNEKNPQPHVFNARLSPANGRAMVSTRIKLADAQKGYLENLKVTRTSDNELASTLADTLNTDRTMDYYTKLEKAISGLSTEVVADALKNRLIWKRIAVAVAGDFAKLEKEKSESK